MKTILNLGCGTDIMESTAGIEYINVDIYLLEGVDIVHDLNLFEYPFKTESIDIILMNDILEHLDNPIAVLLECWRILKKDGKCILRLVYWNHRFSYSDPQHKWAFSEIYFDFFVGKRRAYYMPHHFSDVKIEYHFDPEAKVKYGDNPRILLEKGYYHCNIIQGMEVTLIK